MTYTITAEPNRFRWTVYLDGKQVSTGTRKLESEATKEAEAEIRFRQKRNA